MDDETAPPANQTVPTDEALERSLLADLLESSKLYHTSKDYLELMAFVSRLRNFAPFNAMLLHIQKPGLAYVASAYDWATRFGRSIKEDARPLLILWPFGPVAFVYDVQDTEGGPLPEDVAEIFHATGPMTEESIQTYMSRLAAKGIRAKHMDRGDTQAGFIKKNPSKDKKVKPEYQLRINGNHALATQFVTLAHELGHLYLGHLGADAYLKVKDRSRLQDSAMELEAESVAYLVSHRRGIAAKSQSYLADHVSDGTSLAELDLYELTRAAGQIEDTLGIAAHTLFPPQPRAKHKQQRASQPGPRTAHLTAET